MGVGSGDGGLCACVEAGVGGMTREGVIGDGGVGLGYMRR